MKQEEERKCIVENTVKSKEELLRFVVTPDGLVVPDFKKKLSGKGIFVSNSKKALQTAILKELFSKAAKKKVKADETLVEMVEMLLKKKGLESISLAKKAGELVTGLEKVLEAIKRDKVAFVIEAKNAGRDGKEKIKAKTQDVEILAVYDVEDLDKALDRVNTVHAALLKSEMAKAVHNDLLRLQTFMNS